MFAQFNSSLNIQPSFPPSNPPRTFCPRAEGVKPEAGDGGAQSLCVQTQAAVCICLPTVRARLCAGQRWPPGCSQYPPGHRRCQRDAPLPPSLPGRFEAKGFNFMRLSVITFRSPTLTRTDSLLQKGEDEPVTSPGSGRAAPTKEGKMRGWLCTAHQIGLENNRQRQEGAALPIPALLAALVHHKL